MNQQLLEQYRVLIAGTWPEFPVVVRKVDTSDDDGSIDEFVHILCVPDNRICEVSDTALDLAFALCGNKPPPFHVEAVGIENSRRYFADVCTMGFVDSLLPAVGSVSFAGMGGLWNHATAGEEFALAMLKPSVVGGRTASSMLDTQSVTRICDSMGIIMSATDATNLVRVRAMSTFAIEPIHPSASDYALAA